jgi:hypothetical protein
VKTAVKSQSPASPQNTGKPRVVLVGTYKGDQLEKWRGWYCWPLEAEKPCAKSTKNSVGQPAFLSLAESGA